MTKRSRLRTLTGAVGIPVLFYFAIEIYFQSTNWSKRSLFFLDAHLLGLLIILLFFFLTFAVLGSTFRAAVFFAILSFIVLLVDQLKIVYSGNPVYLSDILFLNTPDTFGDIMKDTFWETLSGLLKGLFLLLLALTTICLLARFCNIHLKRSRVRFGILGATLFSLLFMFLPIKPVNQMMIKGFYEVNADKNNNPVSNISYYLQKGFMGGLYGQYLTSLLHEPDGYRKETAQQILDKYAHATQDTRFGKPDIIMVFSESFWDVSKLSEEVEFDKAPTPNLTRLKDKGMYTEMISPVYGGLSCNAEWEMITGGSLTFFPDGFIPYMNLYKSSEYKKAPSVIRELNNNGYQTELISTWSDKLFNSQNVYDYLGFKKVTFSRDLEEPSYKGSYISDDYVADKLIQTMEANKKKDPDTPLFCMALTAQAHMPFHADKYGIYDISITKSPMPKDEENMYLSYVQGVYDADKQLGKLYDYIQSIEEPTMLIFYGDHLPFVRTSTGEMVTRNLKYFHTGDEVTDTFRKYNTQCIILDNFGAKYEKKQYLGPDLIMPYVMNHMDISLSPFYKYLYQTADLYPASNCFVSVDANGKIVSTKNLDKKTAAAARERQNVNWHEFVEIEK